MAVVCGTFGCEEECMGEEVAARDGDLVARPNAEWLARQFHETYERLAPSFGYETRKASAVPWPQVPENNRALMTAVADEILDRLSQLGRRPVPGTAAPVDGDLVARLRKRAEGSSGFGPTLSADAADEIERLRAALRAIRALHQPEWASEQARAAGKEPWVCSLCGTADGSWPCDTIGTIREVLGDE